MAGVRGKLLSGAIYGSAALVIGTVVTLVATPYFYHQLGEAGYAAFILLSSGIAFSHILALGAHEAALYFLAKPRNLEWVKRKQALGALFVIGGVMGALLWALAYLALPFWVALGGGMEAEVALALQQGLLAAGLLWIAQHFTQGAWALYRARLRLVEVGWMQIATAALPLFGAALALMAGLSLEGFFLAQAAVWTGVGLLALWASTKGPEGFSLRPRLHREFLASSMDYARWALLLQLAFTVQSYGDRFLAAPLGSASLAVYGIATSLTLRLVAALGIVSTLVTPAISKVHAEHGMSRAGRAHGLALRATFWVGAAFFVPLAAGGPLLLGRWVDPLMEARAQGWFPWICAGALWASLAGTMNGTLLGLGRPRVVALTSVLGLISGALAAWALRSQGLLAVAAFGTVAAGVALLTKAAWLHGRVLQTVRVGESLCAAAVLMVLAWGLHRSDWAAAFGDGLGSSIAALGVASLAVLLVGALWDALLSRGKERDSLWSILTQRFRSPA